LIVTGLGAATFDDVFADFTRDANQLPTREKQVEHAVPADQEVLSAPVVESEMEEVSSSPMEVSRDPLDVPAFMRRKAYANISFGS
jgi:hypothetical protein